MSFVYRGLETAIERYTITGHDVEQQLEHIVHENLKTECVTDRPAKNGDEIVFDFAGFCEGVQFPGGTAENYSLVLGSGMFIPGFEEQLIGKEIGEDVTVSVTFPKEYPAEDLAGKAAEFRCKIHEIHIKVPHELNDDFALEFGGVNTMEEFRKDLAASMQSYVDDQTEADLRERLLFQAAESLDFTPSEEEIEKELDKQMDRLSAQLARQGLDLEMYCRLAGANLEELRKDAREDVVAGLRVQAAVDEIAVLEKLTASEEEIEKALELIARQNRMSLEQMKEHCDDEFKNSIAKSVIASKAMKLIRETAVVTEECSHCHGHCHEHRHCHEHGHCHNGNCGCHDEHHHEHEDCCGGHCHCH